MTLSIQGRMPEYQPRCRGFITKVTNEKKYLPNRINVDYIKMVRPLIQSNHIMCQEKKF
jgi:hypothetical protein